MGDPGRPGPGRPGLVVAAVAVVVAVVAAVLLWAPWAEGPAPEPPPASAAPHPVRTPSSSPTPTDASIPDWRDWTFQCADLTAVAADIDRVPIRPVADVDWSVLPDPATGERGRLDPGGTRADPEGPGMQEIVWVDTFARGVWDLTGSVLSASAVNTILLVGRASYDGEAVFSTIYERMGAGDTIVVDTCNGERLTYVLEEKSPAPKETGGYNAWLVDPVPGRLLIVTCNSGGPRDEEGRTLENHVLVLQLVA